MRGVIAHVPPPHPDDVPGRKDQRDEYNPPPPPWACRDYKAIALQPRLKNRAEPAVRDG